MTAKLQDLVVDQRAISEELLTTTLSPLVSLTPGGEPMFKPGARELSNRVRVLTGLLAIMAAARLGLRQNDSVAPKELEALTGVRGSSLRPVLRALVSERLAQGNSGRYRVPEFAFHEAVEVVRNG